MVLRLFLILAAAFWCSTWTFAELRINRGDPTDSTLAVELVLIRHVREATLPASDQLITGIVQEAPPRNRGRQRHQRRNRRRRWRRKRPTSRIHHHRGQGRGPPIIEVVVVDDVRPKWPVPFFVVMPEPQIRVVELETDD